MASRLTEIEAEMTYLAQRVNALLMVSHRDDPDIAPLIDAMAQLAEEAVKIAPQLTDESGILELYRRFTAADTAPVQAEALAAA
jgi:hypothetical protein